MGENKSKRKNIIQVYGGGIMDEKLVQFKGTVVRNTYSGENFKVFAMNVDKNIYPNIKFTKYGNAVISGNLHDLDYGVEYEITAIEENGKYGYGYRVRNIRRDIPSTSLDMQLFLSEILTPNQADVLYDAYPDIVQKVMKNDLADIDLSKTKGIKEYTFEKIKEKIIMNFALVEIVDEFQGAISLSIVKKLYEKYPSIEKIKTEISENPYKCLCGLSNVGFKTADSLLLQIEKTSNENVLKGKKEIIDFSENLKDSEQRCKACVMYLLDENESQGHTKMDIVKLKNQCEKLTPACSHHFVSVLKNSGGIYYNIQDKVVALQNTYNYELYVANFIKKSLANSEHNVWEVQVQKYKTQGDTDLTDEQLTSLSNLCRHNISVLNGNAGSGKSFATKAVIDMLRDNNKTFSIFCPTGRAAKVAAEYTGQDTSTIHRGLGYQPPNQWIFNEENQLCSDVIIVDEFSMADIFLTQKLFSAINPEKTKIMIIGDNSQLPSVAAGNVLHDIMNSEVVPTTTLTRIFRYGEGGLMKVATDTRNSKVFLKKQDSKVISFGTNKDYTFIQSTNKDIVKSAVALYKKLLKEGYEPKDIQVLTAYNKGECGSVALNNHLQEVANKNFNSEQKIKVGEITFYKDDLVIQRVNNYKAKVYTDDEFFDEKHETFIANGEIGRSHSTGNHDMVIDFEKEMVKYSRDDLSGVKLGYSISIHSSQGGSSKIIILLTPRSHIHMLNSNLIYVGLTRTKEKCYHLGDIATINSAIKIKENFNRQTFLREFLTINKK